MTGITTTTPPVPGFELVFIIFGILSVIFIYFYMKTLYSQKKV